MQKQFYFWDHEIITRPNKEYNKLTTTQIMDESGLHCTETLAPISSTDSGGRRWLKMGTHGWREIKEMPVNVA